MPTWTWAAASRRGTSHERTGERRQDALRTLPVPSREAVVLVACDGAGSASHGGVGAALAARVLSRCARDALQAEGWPSDEDVWEWIDLARDRIGAVAAQRGLRMRDFATTVVLVLSTGARTLVVHVGDGAAVVREADAGAWAAASWPAHGEYASTTYFVTDDGGAQARISRIEVAVDRIAVFSDGIERLALDFAANRAHAPFFSGISEPVARSAVQGWDVALSAKLGEYLAGPAVNARTDDDKTLILACLG